MLRSVRGARFRPLRRKRTGDSRLEKEQVPEYGPIWDSMQSSRFPMTVRSAFRPTGNCLAVSAGSGRLGYGLRERFVSERRPPPFFSRIRRKIVPVGEVTREASFRPERAFSGRPIRARIRAGDMPRRRGRLCAAFASFDCPFGRRAEDTDDAQRFASFFPASIRS